VFSYVGATPAVSSGSSLTGLAFVDNTLTFTPAPNANGVAVIGVTVQDDGGTENGGVDTSVEQTFVITVQPVNDPPIANADVATTNMNTPLSFVASLLTANDVAGPPNESDQTLTVSSVGATEGIHGTVTLSDEAADYFKRKGCSVELEPTPTATRSWNTAKGAVIGLFHVTC